MYLSKKERNIYSVGKILRNNKKLRKRDPKAKIIQMGPQLKDYVDDLKSNGLSSSGLQYAQFETKNGLKYPGLVAAKDIPTNTIMVRVPVDCLLTTRVAFKSQIEKVFCQNPKFFAKRFTSDWEDHILLVYLLYQYQKAKKSRWYHLIRNLPRQIDYVIFWKQAQIDSLEDHQFSIGIGKQKFKIQKEAHELQKICLKYPEYFEENTVSLDNIRWIHTHLVTRCFGKYFQYTTMVPFAQLFNHQCTDVYYTMYYKPGNPNDTHEQFYDQITLTQEEIDRLDTTDGTYEAEDYFQDNEQIVYQDQEEKHVTLSEDILKDIRSIKSYLTTFISFNDSVSFKYLYAVYEQLDTVMNIESIAAQRAKLQMIYTSNVKYLTQVKSFYSKLGKSVYSYGIKQRKKNDKQQKQEDQPKQGQVYFSKDWPKDKFDQFLMLCSTKDQFEKGSQVYFCYGRLPNKLLLMRYGFALQHNKYDHMFLRINIEDQVIKQKTMYQVLGEISMNKYRRFKLKRTKINTELITYFRSQLWNFNNNLDLYFKVVDYNRQKLVLNAVQEILKTQLSKFKNSLEQNQKLLENKQLGYHQYFAVVYKLEQQRILTQHINMVNYAKKVLWKLSEGQNLKKILQTETESIHLTFQIMMQNYFKTFV